MSGLHSIHTSMLPIGAKCVSQTGRRKYSYPMSQDGGGAHRAAQAEAAGAGRGLRSAGDGSRHAHRQGVNHHPHGGGGKRGAQRGGDRTDLLHVRRGRLGHDELRGPGPADDQPGGPAQPPPAQPGRLAAR
eukprot:scaffold658129_cov42-Prasinocladus_malaysianus.AAC.1